MCILTTPLFSSNSRRRAATRGYQWCLLMLQFNSSCNSQSCCYTGAKVLRAYRKDAP